jgi:hypothetical protein
LVKEFSLEGTASDERENAMGGETNGKKKGFQKEIS